MRDSLQNDKSRKAAIGSALRYQTQRKEQENLLLKAEVALKRRTLTMSRMLSGFLALLLVAGYGFVRQRQRYLRRIGDERLAQIGQLLRIGGEELSWNTSRADLPPQAREAVEKCRYETRIALRRKLSTEVFNSDKEAEFRQTFTALYPGYLPALKRAASKLTRTDELLAMLLLLDLSSDEIGLTLGISHSGVNKARSRMRKRLGLGSDQRLETYLYEIGI